MKLEHFATGLFLFCLLFAPVTTRGEENRNHGFVDLNGYYDSRDFDVLTINILARFPKNLQYFSFVNYSNDAGTDKNLDLKSFYTEQNLSWRLPEKIPLGFNLQGAMVSGEDNDILRFGLIWDVSNTPWIEGFFKNIDLRYTITLYPFQIDSDSLAPWFRQIEHSYRIDFFPDRLDRRIYLSGFADHNINYGGGSTDHNVWVTEHQLGIRLIDELYAVTEVRHNGFALRQDGVGFGLEYLIPF